MRCVVVCMVVLAFVASGMRGAAGGTASPAPSATSDPFAGPRATFRAARALLLARFDAAKSNTGDAYDSVTRLASGLAALDDEPADARAVRDETLHADLDLAWTQALTSGACPAPAPLGTSESCFRSSIDRTLQPFALYVPEAVGATASPAVVLLRGRGESESDLVSRSELRALAERTHTVLVVPYGRGRATYDRAASQDVLDALDAARVAVPIDPKRTYLAGFSMGGIAAFHVAGYAPSRFAAVLSIVGALDTVDRDAMRTFDRPMYVVNAERDEQITPDHGRESVAFLRANGRAARYYEQKNGVHSLDSVLPALTDAWNDMLAGVVTQAPVTTPDKTFQLPAGPATTPPSQGRPS